MSILPYVKGIKVKVRDCQSFTEEDLYAVFKVFHQTPFYFIGVEAVSETF